MKFRLGAIPVEVNASFLIMGVVLAWGRINDPPALIAWIAIVFVSVLIHELGHALAFQTFGHRPAIQLYALGGLTSGTAGVKSTPLRDLAISLAGPFAGFVTGGMVYLAHRAFAADLPPLGDQILKDLLWVNVGWGVLNLLPMQPLDGGQALSGLIRSFAPVRGERIALGISVAVAAAATIGALLAQWLWAGFIAAWSGVISFQRLRTALARGDDGALDSTLAEAYADLRDSKPASARARAEAALAQATNPLVRKDALQLIAWSHLGEGNAAEAWRALEQLPSGQQADPALRGAILARLEGREKEAVAPLQHAFGLAPSAALGADLVAALIAAEDFGGAYALVLGPHGSKLNDHTHAEVERALFFAGRMEESLQVSGLRFDRHRSADAAYNAACAAARLERYDEAVSWIQRAVDAGYKDFAHLAKDDDLASIRDRPEIQGLIRRA